MYYTFSSNYIILYTSVCTEINIKQQLVDHLEKAQRSLQSLRNQYEEKMTILQQQIRVVEAERDKVIKNLSGRQNERLQEEQIKEMKDKYEKELSLLKRDLKQLQIAKREHALAMKKNVRARESSCSIIVVFLGPTR